ncbi:DNA cytosine methyltransferase [Candidatus Heimdallarchaeota archaeon]|nr:MAG: DNA cytosine methyltransferase [Candidatus Heimdallarchaeota archaeon]
MSNNLNFIDLFSGAGGFSLGFKQQGFIDLLAIDHNEVAATTYTLNFPNSKVIVNDLRKIHSLDISDQLREKIDVILASPPCEPFTSANSKRMKTPWSRFYEDPQGDLIFHAIRIIGDLKPKFFVIENVIPISAGDSKEILRNQFKAVGCEKIYFNHISADKFGCPSIRNRVFISNIRLRLQEVKKKSVKDTISDLPPPNYPNDYQGHFILPIARQAEKKVMKLRPGEAAVHFRGSKAEIRNWIKLEENEVCPTIMGKSRFLHPTLNRSLTVREHARLMSFPDNFIFTGSTEEMINQIGESVPPIVSYGIANIIKKMSI